MHVLLLREEDAADDAYAAALQERGLTSACVRVLAAHTFGVPALAAALRAGPLPSCLVLTSRRAAAALAAALDSLAAPEHAALLAQLRALPALCVGARTASGLAAAAPAALAAAPAAYAGSAAALLPLVIEAARAGAPGPALFVCGERRLDTLPAGLAAAGIAVLEVPVYRVQAAPAEELRAAWAAGAAGAPAPAAGAAPAAPLAAVLFSPSGVEAAQAAGVLRAAAHLVAIGPTTAAALGAAGLRCAAVAPAPTAQGVLQALLSLAL